MSETATGTSAAQINAQQSAERTAQATAISRESNGTGTAPKRTSTRKSAATRRADALQGPARTSAARSAAKSRSRTAPRAATPARTAPAAAKRTSAGPSDRDMKRMVAQHALTSAVDAFMRLPVKTVKSVKYVTLNGIDVPRETAMYALKQTFGYVPPAVWDKRLGVRDVGRPVAPAKTTPAPAPATKSRTSAAKSKTSTTKTSPARTASAA